MLEHIGHVVEVERLLAAGAVDLLHFGADFPVSADIDPEAAVKPQHGFDDALHVVAVGLRPLRGAVDEGAVDGHLTLRTFYRQRQRLFGVRSERRVEFAQGEKAGVQFRYVLHGDFDAQMIHKKALLSVGFENSFVYMLSVFLKLSSAFSSF